MNPSEREVITSPHNVRIKWAASLHKKHERDRTGLMLIEGVRELSLALERGIDIDSVFLCSDLLDQEAGIAIIGSIEKRDIHVTEVGRRVFEKLAYREEGGGIVAVARQPSHALANLPEAACPLYLVADSIEKPGNLGALLRSADGAGVTGFIASNQRTDLYSPNVIRASLGTVFTTPNAISSAAEAIGWLEARSIAIVAATPSATICYTDVDFAVPAAIVVGSEDAGLGSEWLKASIRRVRIPMRGSADSLNVSAAATILLYEALRQRDAVRPS
jgi:TrmH family RNA methyltransferase